MNSVPLRDSDCYPFPRCHEGAEAQDQRIIQAFGAFCQTRCRAKWRGLQPAESLISSIFQSTTAAKGLLSLYFFSSALSNSQYACSPQTTDRVVFLCFMTAKIGLSVFRDTLT